MNFEKRLILFLRDAASVAGVIVIASLIFLFFENKTSPYTTENIHAVKINDRIHIDVRVVRTQQETAKGLSGTESLSDHEGMLFIFDDEARRTFWMQGMLFPLDIIWIAADGRIVDITRNAPVPTGTPERYQPALPAQFVLEVSSGFSEKNRISIGDTVSFHTADEF